eukprot:CAMPEP_0197941128 /NCGR_PEP_ID=MMETSP1439-20131203/122312_1 /TAXON_ID=66791 /ORGANISM="Gonyaulax spinifera, Strain CCMP409" /LENGTH=76 /DNA_ID=CAMNT_0043564315 /DNA_START=1 /DNA_END=228 /DNA_ORIENTATION=-
MMTSSVLLHMSNWKYGSVFRSFDGRPAPERASLSKTSRFRFCPIGTWTVTRLVVRGGDAVDRSSRAEARHSWASFD